MKIMQINCVYRQGSTGTLVHELHMGLQAQGVDSLVLYGRGSGSRVPGVQKLCPEVYAKLQNVLARPRGTMYGGCMLSTWRLIKILRREQPDLVHLQCINGYFVNVYRLIAWLKEQKIKTVLTLHAEFLYTANCAHAYDCEKWKTGCGNCRRWRQETMSWFRDGTACSFREMQAAFRGFEKDLTVVSVSPWLQARARQSEILGSMDHRLIYNGVDTGVFRHCAQGEARGTRLVFHATAMFQESPGHEKGGWYLLELAKRLQNYPVRFLVAGKNKLRGPLPENVTLLGEISDQARLAKCYCQADLTLLTSRRETFSMVCAESLCCGTPVVGFLAGGPESICLPQFSCFVPWGDLDALEQAVRDWLEKPWEREAIAALAQQRYDKENMVREYLQLYGEVIHENRN